jgi:RTX calcium-binding nonapeptide repeat (4 copies)
MPHRLVSALLAVLATAAALPATALASRADVVGSSADRSLTVQGGAAQRNDIAVTGHRSAAGETFFLVTEARDGGPRVLAGQGCTTGSSLAQSDGVFAQILELILGNVPALLANEVRSRSKTVGCISLGGGSLVELGDGDTIRRILIDLKDRDDTAFVASATGAFEEPVPIPPVELRGGGGEDRLTGGPNTDVISGENGDDRVLAREAIADTVLCGSGSDFVTVDLRDVVSPDCETVQRVAVDEQPAATIVSRAVRLTRDGRVRVRLSCPAAAPGGCRGTLWLHPAKGRDRDLGSRRYTLGAGRSGIVAPRLYGPSPRRLRLIAVEQDTQGREKTHTAVVRLRRAALSDASGDRDLTVADLPRLTRVPHSKVGRVRGTRAFIALSFDGERLRAYVCNGGGKRRPTVATWFKGRWDGRSPITLTADGLELRINEVHADGRVTGRLRLEGGAHPFSVKPATRPAGLYDGTKGRGRNKLRATRIVLARGGRRGAVVPTRKICRAVLVTRADGTTFVERRCQYFV